jgi:hypothetical protein
MKKYTEYDLLMVYLNECEDKQLEQQILSSPVACDQLKQLEKEMNAIEKTINNTQTDEDNNDYGHQLWNKIAGQLDSKQKFSWFEKISNILFRPQFSIVGLAALFVASVTFYLLGSYTSGPNKLEKNDLSNQLLTQNIQYHLTQTDLFLTQVSNMPESSQTPMMLNMANHLLSSNRIYRAALTHSESSENENPKVNQLLIELEQVLTEISNSSTDQKQNHLYQYTQDQLLYKVKTFNQQLKNDNTLI